MIDLRRLKVVGAVLALAAVLTSRHVWGEPGKLPLDIRRGTGQLGPDKADQSVAEDLANSKFASGSLVTYRATSGDLLFALQIKPKLDAPPARGRDLLILADTSASQFGLPLAATRELVDQIVANAGPDDRISLWTINTPAATRSLSRGFQAAKSATLRDAVEAFKNESPFGDTDLQSGVRQALRSFQQDGRSGRQHAIVFLGDGMSLHNPLTMADRARLCDDLVKAGIAFFPVPLGPRVDPQNLHGLATGTGGCIVRVLPRERAADTWVRMSQAFNMPILYPTSFRLGAEVAEAFPTKLPPLRPDQPTLVVGKLKAGTSISYTLEGAVADRDVKVQASEAITEPEPENFFLVGIVDQSRNGKDQPALIRADRALAFAQEQGQMARADLLAQGQWALGEQKLDAAENLFKQVRKLDPQDVEAEAGLKVVERLRSGAIKREDLLARADGVGLRFEKGDKGVRVTRERLLALAQADDKPADKPADKAPAPQPGTSAAEDENLLQLQKQRLAVEEQRARQLVDDAERQARQTLRRSPDDAQEDLKRVLAQVRDNPTLSEATRRDLTNRLEGALRNAATQGGLIKREQDEQQRRLADARRRFELEETRVDDEERTRRRILEFQNLFNRARYEAASGLAQAMTQDAIAAGVRPPQSVTAAYFTSTFAQNIRDIEEVRHMREERYLLTMMQVERAAMPFPDEPPVQFAPAATWRAMTRLRRERYESSGLADQDPVTIRRVREMNEKLSKPISLEKGVDPNTPLKDALEFLTDRFDITILVDTEAFKNEGVNEIETQPVRLPKMIGVSLGTVLRLLLSQVNATFLVRRDYIEVTTGARAVAEKVIRVYPVADLVIPIPNSINQQSLQNSLSIFGGAGAAGALGAQGLGGVGFGGQLGGALGGALGLGGLGLGGGLGALGALGGGLGALGGVGIGGALGGGGLGGGAGGGLGLGGGQLNLGVGGGALGFQGGQLGQFGNLGGQFGLQGGDQSVILISLIRQVIGTPKDWAPLRGFNRPQAPGGFFGPGNNQPADEEPTGEDPNLWNDLGYFPPAQALVVKGTSRVHTNIGGGLTAPGRGAGGMGALDPVRPGMLAIAPRRNPPAGDKPAQLAAKDKGSDKNAAKDKEKPVQVARNDGAARDRASRQAQLDPKKVWEEALAKGVNDSGLILATADFLAKMEKFDHVAEFLKANLRQGIVARPWVYEALALALEASGGSPEEIERARVSAVDLEPQDAQGYVRAAKSLADQKHYDRAVAFCRQAAMLEPNAPQPYAEALVYAEAARDSQAMEWAAGRLLRQDWPTASLQLHAQASGRLNSLAQVLEREKRRTEAQQLASVADKMRERDLVLVLTWQGEADLDLEVREPIGTTCSCLQRQTPGGGILLGDTVSETQRESYIAARAFSGKYEVTVRRIWGRPLGGKATLEIIRHQGTPQETRQRETIAFDRVHEMLVMLDDGRRTDAETVPPPSLQRRQANAAPPSSGPGVLARLRALADPENAGTDTGLRGRLASMGVPVTAQDYARTPERSPTDTVAYQSRVQPYVAGGTDFTAQATLSSDRRTLRLSLAPVFQALGRTNAPATTNPLIPGGADPLSPK